MARRRGHSCCLFSSLALLCLACLPDPPAFDACSGEDSHYYVVSPKGCNGHELVSLHESIAADPLQSTAILDRTGQTYVRSTLELDEKYVYWVAPGNVVTRTAKSGNDRSIIYGSSATSVGVLGMDLQQHRLYVGEATLSQTPFGVEEVGSRILEFDLDSLELGSELASSNSASLPSSARVLAELSGIVFSRAVISGNRMFVLQSNGGRILVAVLRTDRPIHASDVQVLVEEGVQEFTIAEESRLVYARYGITSLDLVTGRSEPLVAPDPSTPWGTPPYAANGLLLVPSCTNSGCTWLEVHSDGTRTAAAENIRNNYATGIPVVADARGVYVHAESQNGTSRLLDFSSSSLFPTLMVASLQPVYTVLALDENFVFIRTEDILTAYESKFTTRLLRVTR